MKKTAAPATAPAAPAAAETKPPAPAFDRAAAISVAPRRHEATARTVGFVQTAGEQTHLYSYAGDYIATVTQAEGAAFLPAPAQA